MKMCLGGAIVGLLAALLVLAVGLPIAAFVVIGIALLAIIAGCVDYVRDRGRGHG